jgi:predicted amidohydrolase
MYCEKGATGENLERIRGYLREAQARRVDIVGLPEMSLSGYVDPLKYPQAVLNLDGPEV